jgi:hypothetical protein
MAALVGNLTSVLNPFDWTLLFARQPEPDLEFTDEELDQTIAPRSRGPVSPRKKPSGGRPILWILLMALVGGVAYISMEPELVTEWLSPYLGENTPSPMAMKPKPLASTPQAGPSPNTVAPAPLAPTTSPVASAVTTAVPAITPPPQTAAKPTAPIDPPLDPMFSEGQRVTVTGDQVAPGGSIPLFADSSSSKPGPIVRPGISLTVVDGDLQPAGWMYLVRTDEGTNGWVAEKRLRLKF